MKNYALLIFVSYFSFTHGLDPNRIRGTSEIVFKPEVNVTVDGTGSGSGSTATNNNNLTENDIVPESSTIDAFIGEDDIGTTGYRITEQGTTIRLKKGVNFVGTDDTTEQAVITIAAPNVTIDFDGRRIRYAGPNNTGKIVHCVLVEPSVKTFIIKNGIIAAFTGAAIKSASPTSNLTVNASIKNMLVANCTESIYLENISNSRITNTRFYNNRPATGPAFGIKIIGGNDVRVKECTALNMTSYDSSSDAFMFKNCQNCVLNGCSAIHSTGVTRAGGFHISDSPFYNKIIDCESFSHHASAGSSYGFLVENSAEEEIERNNAVNNTAEGGGISYGFCFKNCTEMSIMKNKAARCDYGFYDDAFQQKFSNLYIGNEARKNKLANYLRLNNSPIDAIEISTGFLQRGLSVSPLDNVSISTD